MRKKELFQVHMKEVLLSTINNPKYKEYSHILPESHVPTIWAHIYADIKFIRLSS